MTRHAFGGGPNDFLVQVGASQDLLALPNAAVTFWTAESGGAQIVDLLDGNGQPTTQILSTAPYGQLPGFTGPNDGTSAMWADGGAGNGRVLIVANDLAARLVALEQAPAPSGLLGAQVPTRYVGATAAGPPAVGTFAVGDFVVDLTGYVWICTAAGTPGTWSQSGTGYELATASWAQYQMTPADGAWHDVPGAGLTIPSGVAYELGLDTSLFFNQGTLAAGAGYGCQLRVVDTATSTTVFWFDWFADAFASANGGTRSQPMRSVAAKPALGAATPVKLQFLLAPATLGQCFLSDMFGNKPSRLVVKKR